MIRNHSHYSLLFATSKPEEIVKKAKSFEKGYVGLTDYCTVAGTVDFIKACKKEKMKPIIGAEIQLKKGTITLVCRNIKGWKELLKVISASNSKENYNDGPQIKFDDLVSLIDTDNFVCIDGYIGSQLFYEIHTDTDCLVLDGDLLVKEIDLTEYNKKMSVFKYYFVEDGIECESYPILNLITKGNIPFNTSYYIDREDAVDHRVLICSRLKCTVSSLPNVAMSSNPEIMPYINSTVFHMRDVDCSNVSDLCENFNILSNPRLPHFDCPNNISEMEYLRQLCREGWKKKLSAKGKVSTPLSMEKYRARVVKELEIAEMANLAGYFLIVQDYVNKAKNEGKLVGVGRGSAGGCLMSYLLDITDVDPLEYGLLMERFYNPSRSYPDHVSFDEHSYIDYICEKLS